MDRHSPGIIGRPAALSLTAIVALLSWAGGSPAQSPAHNPAVRGESAAGALPAQFLEMAARGYYPGRSGQIVLVPRQGHIMTRDDPDVPYMHGSPWPYDTRIPLLFAGPAVEPGRRDDPVRQQDIAVTLAAALGTHMPPTASGRVLPVLRAEAPRLRAIVLIVLDAMRPDYFERFAAELPMLTALRERAAWFTTASVDYIPTNTGVGHATIATGADPSVHGITSNNLYNLQTRRRYDLLEGWRPQDLMALTLADVWQLETRGRAVVLAQGGSVPAAVALGGHGACQLNGTRTVMAGYDQTTGSWRTNPDCYALPEPLATMNARTLWPADGRWMGHKVDTPEAIRRTALFPRFEADAMIRAIETSSLGEDDLADLVLLNFKGPDFVGHKHGQDTPEFRATMREVDRELSRILAAVDGRVGKDYLLAVTADHGMPPEPSSSSHRHFAATVVDLLHDRFDPEGRQLVTYYEPENSQIFIDLDRLVVLKATLGELVRFLETQPFVFAAFGEQEIRRAAGSD